MYNGEERSLCAALWAGRNEAERQGNMANPLVAIVGRPNVGKSTLFNKIAGRRLSITENRPGVTRDRLYADAVWQGKHFTVIDTGGIELKSDDTMWREILRQAELAVEMAQVIVFLMDGREEISSSDYEVAEKLRRSGKPVLLAVNKIDHFSHDKLFDFYALGLGEPFPVSAEHSQGVGDLLDAVVEQFPEGEEEAGERLKIALVGKPNAGKVRSPTVCWGLSVPSSPTLRERPATRSIRPFSTTERRIPSSIRRASAAKRTSPTTSSITASCGRWMRCAVRMCACSSSTAAKG